MMTKSPALDAAQNFLNVVWKSAPPSDADLVACIDKLLAAYHETPSPKFNDTEVDPPKVDWKILVSEVTKRFPDYGFYAVTDPVNLVESSTMMVGDAIDDIADLTKEMREIVWFADNVSVDEAHWYFLQLYSHWGEHARTLAYYLFARQLR